MKRKSITILLAVVLVLVMSLTVLSACNKKHNYSADWKSDADGHWHECVTKKHTDTTPKENHVWDAGVVRTAATEDAKGVMAYTCTICKFEKEEEIPTLGHSFDTSTWKFDTQTHWHPATCAHTDLKGDEAPHTWNEGVETTPAGYGTAGEMTFTCTVCKTTKKEPIAALDAKANAVEINAALDKTYDKTAAVLAQDKVSRKGDGAIKIEYKLKSAADTAYTLTAPVNAGEYTVRVTVAATAEWKAGFATKDFTIAKKALSATATKIYDGNANLTATLNGVVAGDALSATLTMASKNVGAAVKEITLAGANKDNYTLATANVTASITAKKLTASGTKVYDNDNVIESGNVTLKGVVAGDTVSATITMSSNDVGATVGSATLQGADKGNYILEDKDVTGEITKATIEGFAITNASAFANGFKVGEPIPAPTTDYEEIGSGYGAITTVWEVKNGTNWTATTSEDAMKAAGEYRVSINYAEGDNYFAATTGYTTFTVSVKERRLTVRSVESKTYDGAAVANFNFGALVNKLSTPTVEGGQNYTPTNSGEQYVEYRKQGESIYTKVTSTYIPKNAATYEYRIGIKATAEWGEAVSDVRTFTIAQVEIKLEKGYILTSYILQNGNIYLATHSPISGESVKVMLVNGKAGLELSSSNSNYVKQDQKKQVSVQSNLDCFAIANVSNAKASNYKIVKDPKQTKVEITVPPSEKGTSKQITGKSQSTGFDPNQKLLSIWTAVNTGSFQVGQTVIVSDNTGTKLFEAKIVKVGVVDPKGDGTYNITSQSGCVIPSDGKVRIEFDVTGITYDVNKVVGGTVMAK